jgi:hypothetical protein
VADLAVAHVVVGRQSDRRTVRRELGVELAPVSRSSVGVSASDTALDGPGGATPTPSAITSSTGPGRPSERRVLRELERHAFECTDGPRTVPRAYALGRCSTRPAPARRTVRPLPALRGAGRVAARHRGRPSEPRPARDLRPLPRGRDLWLVTVTDTTTGAHDTKPAHWVDASIHAVELTATVAACALIHRLVSGHGIRRHRDARARHPHLLHRPTRQPRRRRVGARRPATVPPIERAVVAVARRPPVAGPVRRGHRRRRSDPADADPRPAGGVDAAPRRRPSHGADPGRGCAGTGRRPTDCSSEGSVTDPTGSRSPPHAPPEGLDLNRNFPAGWGTGVPGQRRPPAQRARDRRPRPRDRARPNICGYNAFHTSGGVLLRPSSTRPDDKLAPWTSGCGSSSVHAAPS